MTTTQTDVHRDHRVLPTGTPVELATTWHRAPHAHGVAVVAPGVAVPARVVHGLADHLAAAGWETISFDFPGVGASPTRAADVPGGMVEWATRDLDSVLAAASDRAAELGELPVVLVGHSAGAWLIGLSQRNELVDGVVAISSMSGAWRGLKRSSWPQLLPAFYGAIPLLTRATGTLPRWSGLGETAPGGAMREWASWGRREDFFFGAPGVEVTLGALRAPVLTVLSSDDEWATDASRRAIWDRTGGPALHLTVDPEEHGGGRIGHLGLLRDRFADTVWTDVVTWMDTLPGPATSE